MKQFTSEDYIKIAIANTYGLDRMDWNKRLNWVNSLLIAAKAEVLDISDDPVADQIWIFENTSVDEAKEPMMFRKACQALRDYYTNNPSGYFMMLDATASG